MSGLKDRIAARITLVPPLVPARIRALYADELAHIPQARIIVDKLRLLGACQQSDRSTAEVCNKR